MNQCVVSMTLAATVYPHKTAKSPKRIHNFMHFKNSIAKPEKNIYGSGYDSEFRAQGNTCRQVTVEAKA